MTRAIYILSLWLLALVGGGAVGLLVPMPASGATITHDRLLGTPIPLAAEDFRALAPATPLSSVTTANGTPVDGSAPILKFPFDAAPDGRYNPDGGPWIDSADLARVGWSLRFPEPVTAFGFGVTDANDQRNSWFYIETAGASASIAPQTEVERGNLHWFTVLFDTPMKTADVIFSTRPSDGFGITTATVAPVPLPAAAWLLLAGLAGLFGLRRAR